MEDARKAMATSSRDHLHAPLSLTRDRFSCLPEPIIYHIFSFFEPNETARLTSVSRKFRQLCINSPYLYFCAGLNSKWGLKRYSDFCTYVDKVMRLRDKQRLGIERFLIHWFCKQPIYNIGGSAVDAWVRIATGCNVRELDVFVDLDRWKSYSLHECVYRCKSLQVLRLNLQMGQLYLLPRKISSEDLFLESVTISGMDFGQNISRCWVSLRRLSLEKVALSSDLNITSDSLVELRISSCEIANRYWRFSLSLKSLSISRCHFRDRCIMNLDCPSLENFVVHGSNFAKQSIFSIASMSLENLGICRSYFQEAFCFRISCPTCVKHIKISSCKFKENCHLEINSSSVEDFTVSDCDFVRPQKRNLIFSPIKRITVRAEKLQALTINSSDKYSHEFPLAISASDIETIRWTGNPVDFSHLESFESLENASIDIKPSCQHKCRAFAEHCKQVKSLIYCVAVLLQSLRYAKFLRTNIWPIEMFFMQNDEPIVFNNLSCLFVMADDLDYQIPVVASFLKGLPNLTKLIISCEQKSHLLTDPNFITSLGLCPETFCLSVVEDWKMVEIHRKIDQYTESC